MSKLIDLTGMVFGKLTVKERLASKNGVAQWLCCCECGNETISSSPNLLYGRKKSCGCLRNKKDISGNTYGELTVVEFLGYKNKNPQWSCRCSCGNTVTVFENGLKYGATKNCGSSVHETIVGKRYGKLVVTGEIISGSKGTPRKYLCVCDCGKTTYVTAGNLNSGNTKSCGCYANDVSAKSSITHGKSKLRIYNIWSKMIARCEKEYETSYKKYGGIGISVCEEWHDFLTFYQWSMENGYDDSLTIDRIDSSGNYSPRNCRWATYKEQANNVKSNILVEYNGELQTLSYWADYFKIPYKTLHSRYRCRGWDFERAISQPIRGRAQ